jgi:hypothetical protein
VIGEDYVSIEMQQLSGLLSVSQMIYEWIWSRGGMMTRENRRTRGKTCPNATLSITNPTWTDLDMNPSLRGEKPATNHLSYGIAK